MEDTGIGKTAIISSRFDVNEIRNLKYPPNNPKFNPNLTPNKTPI